MSPFKTSSCPCILLFFFSQLTLPSCLAHENLQFSYPIFNQNKVQNLDFSQNSNVDKDALQLTRNSATPGSDLSNTSGQITYLYPLQLWKSSCNYSASFSTSFRLNMNFLAQPDVTDPNSISATGATTGGGIAFYLSSHAAFSSLPNSFGQSLGLFDRSVDPVHQQARLVAIEFDSFKDSFDPDGNHVGIDLNGSIKSAYAVSLSPHNVSLTNRSNPSGIYTNVWIDYNCHLHTLDVYLANQGLQIPEKPAVPIISRYLIDLRSYLPESVYVGLSASLGTIHEAHCVHQWNFTSTELPIEPNHNPIPTGIIIGCIIGGAAIALLVIAVLILILVVRRRRRRESWAKSMADLPSLHFGPRKFSYQELKRATKGFSKERKLGQGGFGAVYKGVLTSKSMRTEVAVKCLSQKSKQGEREFKAEVMSMGRMRHKNLVQLLGWSYTGRSRLMLVYEYLPNGSLSQWIGQAGERDAELVMGWERRYHVMKGLAAGLAYLHEEWEVVVLHRDLKPSNVMLDAEFNARIGDFGLAKLVNCDQQGRPETAPIIAGTIGYLAPECLEQGITGKESDMYSVGVIAIELATGRNLSANYLRTLSQLLENSRLEEAADPQLPSFDPTQLELLLKIGLTCCHPDPLARPSIRDVVHALSSSSISSISVPTSPSYTSTFSEHPLTSSSSISSYIMQPPYGR